MFIMFTFRNSSLFLLCSLLTVILHAQPTDYTVEFGDPSLIHTGKCAIQVSGGSIFYAGHALNVAADSIYPEFTKLDENGTVIFSGLISPVESHQTVERMIKDGDSFLLTCNAYSSGDLHPLIIRLDTMGNLMQTISCGSTSVNNQINGIAVDQDGCILVHGAFPDSLQNNTVQFFAQKFNSNGQLLWSFLQSDAEKTIGMDCAFLSDGRIILSGDRHTASGAFNPFLICLDSTGTKQWEFEVSSHYNSGNKSIIQSSSGNLVLVGEAATDSSANFDIILSEVDTAGNLIRHKYLRASNESDAGFHLMETPNHHYLIAGYGYDTIALAKRVVLVETDSTGTELSRRFYGNSPINIGFSIVPSVYPGVIMAGTDYTNGLNILVYEPSVNTGMANIDSDESIFPSLIHSGSEITLPHSTGQIHIYDIEGRIVFSNSQKTDHLTLPDFRSGVYVFSGQIRGVFHSSKFIYVK